MSELLFCHAPIAALPYYIEELGINIYSMEELCYFIAGNVFLLDDSFMNEELCTWIEKQMGAYKLAENLRNVIHAGRRLSVFVDLILEDTCYYSKAEIDNIVSVLEQLDTKKMVVKRPPFFYFIFINPDHVMPLPAQTRQGFPDSEPW